MLAAIVASYCSSGPFAKADDPVFQITILHTNDLHAHEQSFMEGGKLVGGMARLGHMIRELRTQTVNPIVIDAGDIFQGTPFYTLKKGAIETQVLNKIGFDIATIGNHEFDDGPDNLAKQLKIAKYQVICANLDFSAVPELASLVKPYVIKKISGENVGFIGAITPGLTRGSITLGGVKLKASGDNWTKPIAQTVDQLKSKGINKIVIVSHCGIEFDRDLAKTVPDIDIIVGGHSHTRLQPPVVIDHQNGNSTIIVQTGCYGRALGELTATFDAQGKLIEDRTSDRLIDITQQIPEDSDLKLYIDEEAKPLEQQGREVIGKAATEFRMNFNDYLTDSPLGDLVCDALFEEGKKYGAQICLQNRGGIRSHLESGPITLKEVGEVQPFDNTLVVANISGATILKSIENGLAGYLGARFLEVSGLRFGYCKWKPVHQRVYSAFVQNNKGEWKPLDPEAEYRVAINSYNFKSGEGHDFSKATQVQYCEKRLSAIFEDYIRRHKVITPAQLDRIVPLSEMSVSIADNILRVQGLPPDSKLTLLAGEQLGYEMSSLGVAVPLSKPVVLASAKSNAEGAYQFNLDIDNMRTLKYFTVVARHLSKDGNGEEVLISKDVRSGAPLDGATNPKLQ